VKSRKLKLPLSIFGLRGREGRISKLRVIGYTRVSTEEQAAGGLGLEAQEAKIRQYCELYELELICIISDPGMSGKNLDRPGVAKVLDELRRRKGGPDGLVVAKLDRLTRSLTDWKGLITEFFLAEKRRLFSVGEQIDTRTATGRMILNLIMTIAEWEREIIGERTKDALKAKIARGERCGKVRFGYDLAPELHPETGKPFKLVPNPREQEAISVMKSWKAQGKTYRDLVKLVEGLGIETKEGNRIWLPSTIQRILTRPVA
jgi:site-specific DNA recombinase